MVFGLERGIAAALCPDSRPGASDQCLEHHPRLVGCQGLLLAAQALQLKRYENGLFRYVIWPSLSSSRRDAHLERELLVGICLGACPGLLA